MHAILAPPALACAEQRYGRGTRMDERRERKYQQEMLQRGSSNVIGDPRLHPRPFIWHDMTNVADSLIACSSFFL